MKSFKTWRRLAGVLAAASALTAVALVGGASTSHAATAFTVNLQPLIGSSGNEIPQVTFGGKIGYHLFVQNTGDSATQHASIVVTSNTATFFDADNPLCGPGSTSKQMLCTPPGGTLNPGDTFEVNFRFTAPNSGTQVSTSAAISIAAQTVGGNKNKGTTLATSTPVLTNLDAAGVKNDTYLRKNENATTGALTSTHKQNFGVQLPPGLLFDPFGIAVSIHDELGTLCADCLPYFTELTVPAASDVTTPGNPFVDNTGAEPVFNPYGWSMSTRYDSSFKVDGIFHIDDNAVFHVVPACATLVGGGPTLDDPFCWDTFAKGLSVPGPGSLKQANVTGRALENGKGGLF
jgi:hypothetical protein